MNPYVTVLMSVYNGEKYLSEAIESILNQTFTNFEFLIINDGSTDHTREIIISYNDPRIRLIDNETNIGLTHSLNKGIELAKGKYIARMDADDISETDRLEIQVNFFKENPDYVLVSSGAVVIDIHGNEISEMIRDYDYEAIVGNIFYYNPIVHPVVMYNKSIILQIGKYDHQILKAQDYELWFRLLASGYKMLSLPELLIRHREHAESIENKSFSEQEQFACHAVQNGINKCFLKNVKLERIKVFRDIYSGRIHYLQKCEIIRNILFMKSLQISFKKKYHEYQKSIKTFNKNLTYFIEKNTKNEKVTRLLIKIIFQ